MHQVDWVQFRQHEWLAMDFSQFQILDSLEISYSLLFGESTSEPVTETSAQLHILNALPASLRSLCIAHTGHTGNLRDAACITARCFEALLGNAKTKFPALTDLAVAAKEEGGCRKDCEEIFNPLQDRVAEGKVRIRVLEYLLYSGIVVRSAGITID